MNRWRQDPRRAARWRVRKWAYALRLVLWTLTLPLVFWAWSGEWAGDFVEWLGDALPSVEVRR